MTKGSRGLPVFSSHTATEGLLREDEVEVSGPLFELRTTTTGRRVHWVRTGRRHALCGALVAELYQAGSASDIVRMPECEPCARKHERLTRS